MKTKDLQNRLGELSRKIERSFDGVGFVSREVVSDFFGDLNLITSDLSVEGIQVEAIIENDIQFCGSCHQKVSLRKKRIDKAMVGALIKAFNFVIKNKEQTFQIQQIDLTPIEYGVVNHLVRFGLLYKNGFGQGVYGVPRKTVSQFIAGEWKVAEFYETDPTKQEGEEGRRVMSDKRITIDEIPSIKDLKKEYGEGLTEYEWNEDFE